MNDSTIEEQFILLDALMRPPSVEEELAMEKRIRWFKESADVEQLQRHCEAVERQHFHQAHFISNCMTELASNGSTFAVLPVRTKDSKARNFFELSAAFIFSNC